MEKQGLPEPEYEVAGGFVRIVFRRPEGAGDVNGDVNGVVNGDVNGDVTSLKGVLKDIYLIVLNNPGIKCKHPPFRTVLNWICKVV